MAEYQAQREKFRAAGAEIVAVSVDDSGRSEPVRRELGLEFPILCDTRRQVVRAWGIYNPREHGGIAVPSVFVIGRDREVRYRSIDRTAGRVSPAGVLAFLHNRNVPGRVFVRAGFRDFAKAIRNTMRRGGKTPEA